MRLVSYLLKRKNSQDEVLKADRPSMPAMEKKQLRTKVAQETEWTLVCVVMLHIVDTTLHTTLAITDVGDVGTSGMAKWNVNTGPNDAILRHDQLLRIRSIYGRALFLDVKDHSRTQQWRIIVQDAANDVTQGTFVQ